MSKGGFKAACSVLFQRMTSQKFMVYTNHSLIKRCTTYVHIHYNDQLGHIKHTRKSHFSQLHVTVYHINAMSAFQSSLFSEDVMTSSEISLDTNHMQ